MICRTCKDLGEVSVNIPTDLHSGASYKELLPCPDCEKGEEKMKELFP